jgi:ABC-type Na+ transport system ATPase subunit NatA
MTRNILNQKQSKLNFDEIINSGKILICDLSKGKIGEDTSSFLGSLILAKLQLAALNRVHIPMEKRSDFFLSIDEFQNFATVTFAQILSEARKYRLNTILAHQTISQIEEKIRSIVAGFLITGDMVHTKIGSLSEGQKGLVAFARLVIESPGLLILDEPTNHIKNVG